MQCCIKTSAICNWTCLLDVVDCWYSKVDRHVPVHETLESFAYGIDAILVLVTSIWCLAQALVYAVLQLSPASAL